MVLSAPSLWWPRLAAFVLAALAAASAVVWGLRVAAPAASDSVVAVAATPAVVPDVVAVRRALGDVANGGGTNAASQAAPVLESARFALLGVVAQGQTKGAALLSVDGKPAKPVAVGAPVVDGWTLQSVQGRRATLVRNGMEMVLELPASVPAAAGLGVAAPPVAQAPVVAAPVAAAPVAAPAMSMAAMVAATQPAQAKAESAGPSIALKGKTAP